MVESSPYKKVGVFLDRDGTIDVEVGYLNSPKQLRLIPKSAKAIKLLNDKNIPVIVTTNQSGISRGYFTKETLEKIHNKLIKLLAKENAYVDAIYYCAHFPDFKCLCRKPKLGMFNKGVKNFKLSPKKCYIVGDKASDVEFGKNAKAKSILVLTGYGKDERKVLTTKPDYIANDLYQTVKWILKDIEKNNG